MFRLVLLTDLLYRREGKKPQEEGENVIVSCICLGHKYSKSERVS